MENGTTFKRLCGSLLENRIGIGSGNEYTTGSKIVQESKASFNICQDQMLHEENMFRSDRLSELCLMI